MDFKAWLHEPETFTDCGAASEVESFLSGPGYRRVEADRRASVSAVAAGIEPPGIHYRAKRSAPAEEILEEGRVNREGSCRGRLFQFIPRAA